MSDVKAAQGTGSGLGRGSIIFSARELKMNHQAIQMTGARAGIGCATALAAALEGCNHDISVRDRQTAAAYEAASFSPGQVPAAGGGTSAA